MGVTGPRDLLPSERHPAPDVLRSLALAGVIVMNYHGYLIVRGAARRDGWLSDLFDPWTGVFSTRFAATFVLVAGIGVTLMTRSALGDPERIRTLRWRLASRGLVLYAFGLAFDFVWAGTILPFYGAMFALAALLFTLATRWVAAVGAVAALASWAIAWWGVERGLGGHDTRWLTDPGPRSVRGLAFDVFVNGTHPLLPWLAFFCAGIVVGRMIGSPRFSHDLVLTGFALFAISVIARAAVFDPADARAAVLFSTDPFNRGLVYVMSALGTALMATGAIWWLADRFVAGQVVDVLRRAGQLSLTVYLLHALLFNLVVDWFGWIGRGHVVVALAFALGVWVTAVLAAAGWQRLFQRGPFEQVYRSITR